MSHFTPAKDARVEKLRRLLREGSVITKYDFLDFVSVYKHFHEAGFKVRPTLTKWIQENHKTVLEWLPDILKVRPGFFADLQPNSKYNTFKEYQTLAALGLSGQGSSEPPLDHQPVSRRSPDLGTASTPANVTLRELSDFGTPIPDSAIIKRPSLSGQTQQKVWLDDIKEVHHHLREIKSWLVKSSQALGPRDPMTPSLTEAAQRIPDFSDRVDTAQLCFDDIKSQYDQEVAELMRGRARMPRYSPAPMEVEGEVAERERTATAVPDAKAHVQSPSPTILVVSDIVREGQASSAGARSETAAEAGTARNLGTARQMNGPRDDGVPATPHREIPRRSAMPLNTNRGQAPSLKRKFPGAASASDSTALSSDGSDSDDDSLPDIQQLVTPDPKRDPKSATGAKSVYSIDSDNDAPASVKRARVSVGQARRPQRLNTSGNISVSEALMG